MIHSILRDLQNNACSLQNNACKTTIVPAFFSSTFFATERLTKRKV